MITFYAQLITVALWCGTPYSLRLPSDVDACRIALIECIIAAKGDSNIAKCFLGTRIDK